ncbi:MAG: putative transport protein [Caulobacteraceae bacterium]|nr:putative transport protein [Caulobacteraceae bacterium]
MKLNWPILALAVGAFGIGVTEFAPMGLLPVIAQGLKVSIPQAGLLVSGYALGVLVGAPLLTLPTGGLNRKTLLLGLMGLFTVGNFLSAIAPNYAMLMLARILTSFCHGSFFGVGSVVAGKLVANKREGGGGQAGAVADMFSGLTIANVGGVPLAAWVGHHIGWRMAFAGIAGLGVIASVCLVLALPSLPGDKEARVSQEFRVLRRREVLLALLTTALGSSAMFTVFTYIAPILETATRVSPNVVTVALVVYGLGLTLGNWLGGRFADKALTPTLVVVLTCLAALLGLFAITMRWKVPALATVFAWGVATFALVPALQARVMSVAREAPTLASSINIGSFNLGNAAGAALGGGVIALGLPYPWVAIAGAATALGGLALVLLTARRSSPTAR